MKIFTIFLALNFFAINTYAQLPGLDIQGMSNSGMGSEFFVGRIEGKPLITVNLVGGVKFPGVYHVPIQTELTQLFSYAGGIVDNADLSRIHLRSQKGDQFLSRKVDAKDLFTDNKALPYMQDRDTVLVETKSETLLNTSMWIGIVSGVAGIVLSTMLITNARR